MSKEAELLALLINTRLKLQKMRLSVGTHYVLLCYEKRYKRKQVWNSDMFSFLLLLCGSEAHSLGNKMNWIPLPVFMGFSLDLTALNFLFNQPVSNCVQAVSADFIYWHEKASPRSCWQSRQKVLETFLHFSCSHFI